MADTIKKLYFNKVTAEDIEWGIGTISQTRGGNAVVLNKVNLAELPIDEFTTLQDLNDVITDLTPTQLYNVGVNIADVNTVASIVDSGALATANSNSAAINTVADNIADVNTVAADSIVVNTVAADSIVVNTVAADSTVVNIVADNIADVNTVAADSTAINTVAADSIAINTVAADSASINALVDENTGLATLIDNQANVDIVANDISSVVAAATDIANVNAVAGNKTNIDEVATNSTNINAVNANETNINTVSANNPNVTAVGSNIANVNSVASNETNINSLVANETNINTVVSYIVPNLTEILQADTNASTATTQAGIATTQAEIAQGYANSIDPSSATAMSIPASQLVSGTVSVVGTDLVITDRNMLFSQGATSTGGFKNTSEVVIGNETIPTSIFSGISGDCYVKKIEGGSWEANVNEPIFGTYAPEVDDNREVYDSKTGKWYSVITSGVQHITNGTFDTDTSGWLNNGTGSIAWSSGSMVLTRGTLSPVAYQAITNLDVGKEYTLTLDSVGAVVVYIGTSLGGQQILPTNIVSGAVSLSFTPTTDTAYVHVYASTNPSTVYIDNVSISDVQVSSITELPAQTYIQYKATIASDEVVDVTAVDMPTLVTEYVKAEKVVVTDGFDLGQSWVDVTSERALDVTYTNNTGKPISTYAWVGNSSRQTLVFEVDGLYVNYNTAYATGSTATGITCIVPSGSTYKLVVLAGGTTVIEWHELR